MRLPLYGFVLYAFRKPVPYSIFPQLATLFGLTLTVCLGFLLADMTHVLRCIQNLRRLRKSN